MIDTSNMPAAFGLCLATEAECPKAGTCLRSLVLQQYKTAGECSGFVSVVNPYKADNHYATEECAAYSSCQKVRYARGMSHLFDDVKMSDHKTVRGQVMSCFSCESFFYRSQNGTRLISPEEQARIAQVFREMNLGVEPEFDSYEEHYSWG